MAFGPKKVLKGQIFGLKKGLGQKVSRQSVTRHPGEYGFSSQKIAQNHRKCQCFKDKWKCPVCTSHFFLPAFWLHLSCLLLRFTGLDYHRVLNLWIIDRGGIKIFLTFPSKGLEFQNGPTDFQTFLRPCYVLVLKKISNYINKIINIPYYILINIIEYILM